MARAQGVKQIAQNRKAFHDYFVLERYEAGIELFGTEVKSIRAGTVNLKEGVTEVQHEAKVGADEIARAAQAEAETAAKEEA